MPDKPALTPPPGPPPSGTTHGAATRLFVMVFVALLLAGAVAVVLLLPAHVERQRAQPAADPDSAATTTQSPARELQAEPATAAEQRSRDDPPLPVAQSGVVQNEVPPALSPAAAVTARPDAAPLAADRLRAKEAAELALRDAVALQVRLENAGVDEWGEERFETSYPQARAELAAADGLMSAARFEEAEARYREAARLLQLLQDNAPRRLQQSLERGYQSLETEAARSAADDFTRALALDPASVEAQTGLDRARRRPAALAELERGRALEEQGDLPAAKQAYDAALLVEPEFAAAQSAAEQAETRIRQRAFDEAIDEAVSALDAGRYGAAGKALAQARRLDPASNQVATLARRLAAQRQQALLGSLRVKAAALEAQEQWSEAVALYDEALAVDATVAFAVNGRERAGGFARLHEEMARYLQAPERLNSPDPLARASSLLEAANRVRPAGPRLERERSQLARLVEAAQQPATVTLNSDGQTNVIIRRVVRLGTFVTHTLQLKPGSYVAVGTRPGYRDVRVVLEVAPGAAKMVVDVRCEEKI